jgi:hemerythrin superfamily protein
MNTNTPSSEGSSQQPSSHSYAGRSADEIVSEIERTREELGRTLEALQAKLSPRQRARAFTSSARDMGLRFARSARESLTPDITTMIRLDHTHVLALFHRFRPSTSARRKAALVESACLALEVHTRLEEEIFYPALVQVVGRSEILDEILEEVLEKGETEHEEMRKIMAQLRALQVGDPAFDDMFQMLVRTVLHHIADEESTLLPLAETALTDRLGELGMRMTKRRMQLLKPSLGRVAATTARSFPVATTAAAVGILALGWLLIRPGHHHRERI